MALTPEEHARYTALLEAAEAAFHSLMTGGAVVDFTDQNQERVRYTAANRGSLFNYINWLRGLLGLCPFVMQAPGRPAGVLF